MNADPIDPSAMVDSLVPKGGPPVSNAKGSPICGVYGIWCEANEKWYVGQSRDIEKRWKRHQSNLEKNQHDNCILQRTWNLHGESAFLWVIFERVPHQDLASAELRISNQLSSMVPTGFNLKVGEFQGVISAETRTKMSRAKLGRKCGPPSAQTKAKISAALTGKKLPPEVLARAIAKRPPYPLGLVPSAATRAKISKSKMGHLVSEETRAKLSAAHLGRKQTPEQIAAMLAGKRRAREQRNQKQLSPPSGPKPS